MFCPNCGTKNIESASYCGQCGFHIGAVKQNIAKQSPAASTEPVSTTQPKTNTVGPTDSPKQQTPQIIQATTANRRKLRWGWPLLIVLLFLGTAAATAIKFFPEQLAKIPVLNRWGIIADNPPTLPGSEWVSDESEIILYIDARRLRDKLDWRRTLESLPESMGYRMTNNIREIEEETGIPLDELETVCLGFDHRFRSGSVFLKGKINRAFLESSFRENGANVQPKKLGAMDCMVDSYGMDNQAQAVLLFPAADEVVFVTGDACESRALAIIDNHAAGRSLANSASWKAAVGEIEAPFSLWLGMSLPDEARTSSQQVRHDLEEQGLAASTAGLVQGVLSDLRIVIVQTDFDRGLQLKLIAPVADGVVINEAVNNQATHVRALGDFLQAQMADAGAPGFAMDIVRWAQGNITLSAAKNCLVAKATIPTSQLAKWCADAGMKVSVESLFK